jgi:ketosteroid isomerase-like protein
MSQENAEIVRRIYDAVASGDDASVLAAYDPGVEMDFTRSPIVRFLRKDVYRGHEGLRDLIKERYEEAWGTIEDLCEQLIDADDEHVVSVVRTRGRGRVSGAPVELRHAGLWRIRDGKVVRVAWFGSRDEALEAARVGA